MQRTFSWLQPFTGNFDGPGSWADVTSGTPEVTLDIPGTADIAVFNGVSVTVGVGGSFGVAGTLEAVQSTVSLIGPVEFGAFALGTDATFDVASQGTLTYVPGWQTTAEIAVEVGGTGVTHAVLSVAGADALVSVLDPTSNAAYLQIGATGTLLVDAGGSVDADVLDLAGSGAGLAFGSIDGGASTTDGTAMVNAGGIAVGDGGPSLLTITNGALVEAGVLIVGTSEPNRPGGGTLLITGGGAVVVGAFADFGDGGGDQGNATIDGAGCSLASAGLFVGNGGSGVVTIENGATLTTAIEAGDSTSFAGAIANASGAAGSLLIAGVGSVWRVAGRVDIGLGGAGTLDVVDGGAVNSTVGPVQVGTDYDASLALVQATVLVADVGSTLDAGGGPIYVGDGGTASFTVQQGAEATAAAPAADYAAVQLGLNGGTGTLTVSGDGSGFTSLGQLDVGGISGTGDVGTLAVSAGATVQTGGQAADPLAGMSLGDGGGSQGIATIDGSGTLVRNSGRLDIGRAGAGTLSISNGATLATQLSSVGQSEQPASILLGVDAGSSGTVFVVGAGSALSTAQDMIVGLGGDGGLQVLDSGDVSIAGNLGIGSALDSGATGNGQGVVTVSAAALSAGGTLAVGGVATGFSGTGTLTIGPGGAVSIGRSASMVAGSAIVLAGGAMTIGTAGTMPGSGLLVAADAAFTGAGTVQGTATVLGTLSAIGGLLSLSATGGTGELGIAASSTLDPGQLTGGTVDFLGPGTLRLETPANGTALIVGTPGGTIDLTNAASATASIDAGTLTVHAGATAMTMAVISYVPTGALATRPDGAGGTEVILPCFAAGTRLAAPGGAIAVEAVRPGDVLLTAGGRAAPVVWVGRRTLACRLHPRPGEVQPVLVRAGALAAGVPGRDLRLSPDHALCVGKSLIPVRYLLNGMSIVQEDAERIEYCHVELDRHDVLLAEGAAAESFLDTGNRHAFAVPGQPVLLHPDFARRVWAEKGCAPLVLEGPALVRAKALFLRRAATLGYRRTRDPGLRVIAAGRTLRAEICGDMWQVAVPAGTTAVRLRSRTWVPAHMRPRESDTRMLGVALTRLTLDGRAVALDSPALAEGWLPAEPDWRWTNGDALLPVGGARRLSFDLARLGEYWAGAHRDARAAAAG